MLSRETALELYTRGSAWFSAEQGKKGQIKEGQLADFVALSSDYFSIPEEAIKTLESVMTIVGGEVVYASGPFASLGPDPLPVTPDWSPVAHVPGHWRASDVPMRSIDEVGALVHHCAGSCAVHGHDHDVARRSSVPASDLQSFWGAVGCSCFTF